MANKEVSPVSLATMLGVGESFVIGDKKYVIKPLKLKDVVAFTDEQLSIGSQLFNLLNEDVKKNLDKWLSKQVFTQDNKPMSLENALNDDWDLVDLKRCMQRMLDISG